MSTEIQLAPPTGLRFVIGSDHAGFALKDQIRDYLIENGNAVCDVEPQFRERIEFPPVAADVARQAAADAGLTGILVCGSGLGMCIAANKVPGARAAVLWTEVLAQYARQHNNVNVLVFAGRMMDFPQTCRNIETFFAYSFLDGKYAVRNATIARIACGEA